MEWHTFQSFSYAECGFPHSGYRSGSLALYLIHEFLFLNFQIHRISTLSFRLSSIDKSDNMLHSPSGFPSRISCRIIGCDFSSLDTFTYCLLKAVFHKYHAAEFIMRWRLLGARRFPDRDPGTSVTCGCRLHLRSEDLQLHAGRRYIKLVCSHACDRTVRRRRCDLPR